MASTPPTLGLATLFLTGAFASLAPVVTGHCPLGPQPAIQDLIETNLTAIDELVGELTGQKLSDICLINTPMEAAVEALNEAADGHVAFVLISYQRFHPNVVHIRSGGTVVVVAPDPQEWTPAIHHDVVSSGPCLDPVDPETDPEACRPTERGACFYSDYDLGGSMPDQGRWLYPLTLRLDGDQVEKAFGVEDNALLDPLGLAKFTDCPEGSGVVKPDRVVVPYHCGFHGINEFERAGYKYGLMRGAIAVHRTWAGLPTEGLIVR